MKPIQSILALATLLAAAANSAVAVEVVAFWGFADDYVFTTNPNKQDFAAEVDATVAGDANLQAYLGNADELDDNGGGGFVGYTSPASGLVYGPTRTIKWDDLRGGGDDFDIGGVSSFQVDKLEGAGPEADDFSNDALIYLTLDGTGYTDFGIRFDIEGTPGSLPDSFDVFYRVDGPTGTWFRDPTQNNLPLAFLDYDPADPENQFADSGVVALSPSLNNASTIEVLISDFAENGNGEMEIDNIEITATAVPEPAGWMVAVLGGLAVNATLRKKKQRA